MPPEKDRRHFRSAAYRVKKFSVYKMQSSPMGRVKGASNSA
jgi:hypothetical protein